MVHASVALPELVVGYMIKDRLGQTVFGSNTHYLKCKTMQVVAGATIEYRFGFFANLGEGTYSIAVALHTAASHIEKNYEWRDLALIFNVTNIDKDSFVGVAWLPPTLEQL